MGARRRQVGAKDTAGAGIAPWRSGAASASSRCMTLRNVSRLFALLLCAALAACGDLPEPFLGNPGATARRLAVPTPLLVVAPGTDTLLPDAANQALAKELAEQLQAIEVPAIARIPQDTEWRLITTASERNGAVTPTFTILNPAGKTEARVQGEAVPVKDWAMAPPALTSRVAAGAAPRISAVLADIRLTRDKADPNSLYNRPAKVMVADVTGAPADGNQSLTRLMRARLAMLGPVVLTTRTGADFIVTGTVIIAKLPQRKERVEVQWVIMTPSGDERGKVFQLNEVPAGSLDKSWSEVAPLVAAEAASGVNNVVRRQSGHDPNEEQPAKTASQDAPPPR